MLFKPSNLNSNLALTLGYLNPGLNNSGQGETWTRSGPLNCKSSVPNRPATLPYSKDDEHSYFSSDEHSYCTEAVIL